MTLKNKRLNLAPLRRSSPPEHLGALTSFVRSEQGDRLLHLAVRGATKPNVRGWARCCGECASWASCCLLDGCWSLWFCANWGWDVVVFFFFVCTDTNPAAALIAGGCTCSGPSGRMWFRLVCRLDWRFLHFLLLLHKLAVAAVRARMV